WVGDGRGAPGDEGLAHVVGRHAPAPGGEALEDAVGHLVVVLEGDAHDPGDGVAGDVVLGRPEPTADDHRGGAGQRELEGADDALEVVAHDLAVGVVDAGQGQLLADPGRVGVDDLAEQQLGADRHDLTAHRGTSSST